MLAGWRRKGMCWRSGSVGLCKEVGQEGVGRLAPKRNVQAAGKRWALGRWPAKPETRYRLLGNVHLVFSRLKNSRLLFLFAS